MAYSIHVLDCWLFILYKAELILVIMCMIDNLCMQVHKVLVVVFFTDVKFKLL